MYDPPIPLSIFLLLNTTSKTQPVKQGVIYESILLTLPYQALQALVKENLHEKPKY